VALAASLQVFFFFKVGQSLFSVYACMAKNAAFPIKLYPSRSSGAALSEAWRILMVVWSCSVYSRADTAKT